MNKLLFIVLGSLVAMPSVAQWDHSDRNVPRKADGKINMDAPAPRLPNGRPDLSGLWYIPDIQEFDWNLGKDLEGGGPPMKPWARKLVRQRIARNLIDDPSSRCFPTGLIGLELISPFRISVTRDRVIVLFEQNTTFRQIFMDGRGLPKDPSPSYMGYSIGHWEGNTLVVESTGFNGKSWIDADGHPITEQARLTERIRRLKFGRLEIEFIINDPLAYTKTWSARIPFNYVPDSEVTESFCEDNLFTEQLKAAGLTPMDVVPQEPPESGTEASDDSDAAFSTAEHDLRVILEGFPIKDNQEGVGVILSSDALFEEGKAIMKPDAAGTLDRLANALKQIPQRRATIKGYTDNVGTDEFEQQLSDQRAKAVRSALVDRGVSVWQTTAVGEGKKYPIASNDDPGGRQKNRRIEVSFNINN
jgi:outer membrane protein OmpA-like peptidoglycan-associated protein